MIYNENIGVGVIINMASQTNESAHILQTAVIVGATGNIVRTL